MARQDNFQARLVLEVHEREPELDLGSWDHVVEFQLHVPSGSLTLEASGGSGKQTVEVPAGTYLARWAGKRLDEAAAWAYGDAENEANPPDEYRVQLWPAGYDSPLRELKRSGHYDA